MYKKGIEGFPYYLGIASLADVATRADRVCVLNILGGESRQVTPVSHVFSGGNVVFGTSPGRRGQVLATSAGDIPVYNNVREGLDDGISFSTGVVYLPPSGVRDGVAELIRVNPDLRKIVMITEKIAVHDAREIRALGQANGIDILGANCLGVADSWNRVRIGGALGGDNPEEVLLKGSIAIFSNSGGFTTTIAQYLSTEGWGTTTLVSSGKDVYIHYAARDFAHAFNNDMRSKAAVLYAEPGGYYERGLEFAKPVVACVVGRWKSKLTRAVGHAGAMAGSGDKAEDKERWFMENFGVDAIFTPETPVVSAKGAIVSNIAHIPLALTAVMKLNNVRPDFDPRGSLSLKPWIANDQGIELPPQLALRPVEAVPPYDTQIKVLSRQVGAVIPRQNMKDKSGSTVMDPKTQVTSVHGHSVLELALLPLEANFALPLVHEIAGENDRAMLDIAVAAETNLVGDPALMAAEAAREAGNSPNTVMAAAAAIVGPKRVERALSCATRLIDLFARSGLLDARDEGFDLRPIKVDENTRALFSATAAEANDPRPEAMLKAVRDRGGKSLFLKFLETLGARPSRDAILAAIATTIAWGPLMRKRISRLTAETLPWYLRLYGVMIGASIPAKYHQPGSLCGISREERFSRWSMADVLFLALTGKKPSEAEARPLQILIGLLISNGPGSISAQGAKGAVAADGPQTPGRVQINKAMVGFLTHSGYSHGGNGFEGMAFLLEQFKNASLQDPTDRNHGIDLKAMAARFAETYREEKSQSKETGLDGPRALPGVHHPIFRGKPVNYDPRERFIAEFMSKRGDYNIFHAYYRELVQALYDAGASRYVFCVNVDAVIAALLLAVLWKDYRSGALTEKDLETAAFNVFLYGRMIGAAAEIDDHLNRGRNMDTRTPAGAVCVRGLNLFNRRTGGQHDDTGEFRPTREDHVGHPRFERKFSGNVRLLRLRLLRDGDRKSVLSHGQRICPADAGLHDLRCGLPDAPARRHLSRHVHRPLWPPCRTDADPWAHGDRHGHDRSGSGLCDAWCLGPYHRGDRPSDPGLLRRRRARRRLGLSGRDRDTRAQGLLRQLAIRQPAGRSDFRRCPWRAPERTRPSRVDDGMGLAYTLPHRLPDHSAPVHSAQLPPGNRRVRATPARRQPSQTAGNPAAARAELADRHHRHAARDHDDGLVLFHHRLYPDLSAATFSSSAISKAWS